MRYALGSARREWTCRLAAPTLIAFDFDGTLAPIVDDREAARARAGTRRLLAALAARAPCAVISGRSTADLRARLAGVPVRHLVGNHGASAAARPARREVARAIRALRAALASQPGVEVEDAGRSLAVHWRRAAHPRVARRAVERAVEAESGGMRVVPGKMVMNLVPASLPHKGDALVGLLGATGLGRAVYVGDDRTDEDVFALAGSIDLAGVRVGRSRQSSAAWFLRDQHEIDDFLRLLVSAHDPRGRASF